MNESVQINALQELLDGYDCWLLVFIGMVVLGVILEVYDVYKDHKREVVWWKKLIGPILVALGVAGEFFIHVRSGHAESKLRNANQQVVAQLNLKAQTLAMDLQRAQARLSDNARLDELKSELTQNRSRKAFQELLLLANNNPALAKFIANNLEQFRQTLKTGEYYLLGEPQVNGPKDIADFLDRFNDRKLAAQDKLKFLRWVARLMQDAKIFDDEKTEQKKQVVSLIMKQIDSEDDLVIVSGFLHVLSNLNVFGVSPPPVNGVPMERVLTLEKVRVWWTVNKVKVDPAHESTRD